MQIPSSPDSSYVLLRPGVLGNEQWHLLFFFFYLLYSLTPRMVIGVKRKALSEQKNGEFYLFRRRNVNLCIIC